MVLAAAGDGLRRLQEGGLGDPRIRAPGLQRRLGLVVPAMPDWERWP